jgi:hypothetical protein
VAVVETDWAAVQEGIRAWIEVLSGLPTYYRNDNVPQHDAEAPAHMLLHIASIEEQGLKTTDYELTGSGLASFAVPRASRLVRMILEVDCQAGWNVPGTLAPTYLARTQLKAQIAELREELEEVDGAFNSAGPITTIDFEQDGWSLSQASSSWVLTFHDTWQDTDVTVETIESVEGEDGYFTHVTTSLP